MCANVVRNQDFLCKNFLKREIHKIKELKWKPCNLKCEWRGSVSLVSQLDAMITQRDKHFMSGLWSLTPVYHQKEQGPLWEMADEHKCVMKMAAVSWKNAQPKRRKGLRGSGTCLPKIRKTLKDYGVRVRNRSDDVTNPISVMSLNSSVPLWNCFPMWAMGMPFPPGWVLGGIKHTKSFPGGPVVNNLPAVWETWFDQTRKIYLDKETATHSRIFAWKIPWTEEPDGLQSMGSQSRTRLSN